MTVESYGRARRMIEESGGGDFVGHRSEELVARAEAALGVVFPPSYRSFVLELGCGGVDGVEFYGVLGGDFERSGIPDGVWLTLRERRELGLDSRYVIIEDVGDGTCCALDVEDVDARGEAAVVVLSVSRKVSERVAGSFGEYFLEQVELALEG